MGWAQLGRAWRTPRAPSEPRGPHPCPATPTVSPGCCQRCDTPRWLCCCCSLDLIPINPRAGMLRACPDRAGSGGCPPSRTRQSRAQLSKAAEAFISSTSRAAKACGRCPAGWAQGPLPSPGPSRPRPRPSQARRSRPGPGGGWRGCGTPRLPRHEAKPGAPNPRPAPREGLRGTCGTSGGGGQRCVTAGTA